jgi:hypothetical protein
MCKYSILTPLLLTVIFGLLHVGCGSNEKARPAGEPYQHDIAEDIQLLEKLRAMASETDSVSIADLAEEARLVKRFQYRLADMLQNGEAVVYDKNTGKKAKSIMVERFEFMAHKTAGRGGRRFYLPDSTLFFEVIDWMS